MKFEKYPLSREIKKSLAEAGFTRPTDIQHRSITPILGGEDVLGIAQTGTGKTAAFAIPILDMVQKLKREQEEEYIKCMVMVPTRELAIQISGVFTELAKYTDVKIVCITGGVEQTPQIESLQKGMDILIATPGRMFDLIYQKHIRITRVQILVLDEADQMLDLGFYKDIQDIKKFLPKVHQTLFFSATISEKIKDLAYSLVRNPIRIQIAPKDRVSKNIDHSLAYIAMDDKRFFLERILKENPDSRILVFVRTKVRAERVFKAMERIGILTQTMHGDKEQEDRTKVMEAFREGKIKVLIATDISARGIDIPNVEYVINYDLPDEIENYVHRVGRTGRGNNRGIAVSFCSEEEKEILAEIEDFLGKPIKVLVLDETEYSQTVDFSDDSSTNWKSLMKQSEEELKAVKDKNFKKGKKK